MRVHVNVHSVTNTSVISWNASLLLIQLIFSIYALGQINGDQEENQEESVVSMLFEGIRASKIQNSLLPANITYNF
jgi:hypothetical protein